MEFDGLGYNVENDETDRVDPITRLVDEGTERPYSNSKITTKVHSRTHFVYISCLSDLSLIKLNSYKHMSII